MPSPGSRRWLRRGLVAAGVLLALAAAGVAFVLLHAPGNVSHPNVQFTSATTPPTTVASVPPRPHARPADTFLWPWYGLDGGRTRFFAGPADLHPPLHVGWTFHDGALLEFPPAIEGTTLYSLDDDASAKAISASTGRVLWQRKLGTLAAASPALAVPEKLMLVPILSLDGHAPGDGRFVALSMQSGKVAWSMPLPAGSESSPIVSGHTVYFGDQGGTLRAVDVTNGHLEWSYHAAGAIKGGPAMVGGVLYFGDYAGRAYAVRARDGHELWSVGTNGAHFGFGSGQFYATPAVAFGRVYMGNTDGRVYSFGMSDGTLAWATATGAYVYASAAVADPPGVGPTVYVGSYDGNLYAFDARSGAIRWRHPAGGRISGAATVVGNVVYYSDLGTRTTTGLNASTGAQVFSFPDGAFNPVVADDHAIYLDGYTTMYELLPATPRRRRGTATGASPRTGSGGSPRRRSGSSSRGSARPRSGRRGGHRAAVAQT